MEGENSESLQGVMSNSNIALEESILDIMNQKEIEHKEVHEVKKQHREISDRFNNLTERINRTLGKLNRTYTTFSGNFAKDIETNKITLKKKMNRGLMKVSKAKLPDIYLRSIPKFKGNKVTNALHTTLLEMKRMIERNDRLIRLRYDKDLVKEMNEEIGKRVEEHFLDSEDIVRVLVGKTETIIQEGIKKGIEDLNINISNFKDRNQNAIEQFKELKKLSEKKNEEEKLMEEMFVEEDEFMDQKRIEVRKIDEELERQRTSFYEELLTVQTKLYEKEKKHKTFTENEVPIGHFSMEIMKQQEKRGDDLLTRMEVEAEKKIREMWENFELEKKMMIDQAKREMSEKENSIEKRDLIISKMKKKLEREIRKNQYQ